MEMSDKVELYYWLGGAYWKKSRADRSIRNYRQAVALDPQHKNPFSLYALENLAEVYTRTERLPRVDGGLSGGTEARNTAGVDF